MWIVANRFSWPSPHGEGAPTARAPPLRQPRTLPLTFPLPLPCPLPFAPLLLSAAVMAAWSAPLYVDFSSDCYKVDCSVLHY